MRPPENRQRTRSSAAWAVAATELLAVAAALSAMAPLLRGVEWAVLPMLTVAAVLGAGALVRRLGAPRWAQPFLVLGAGVLSLCGLFASGQSLLAVLPTGDTATRFRQLSEQGLVSIAEQSTPALADAGIVFLLSVGSAAVAVLVDALVHAARLPALALLPLGAIVAASTFLGPEGTSIPALILTVGAYLLLLLADTAEKNRTLSTRVPAAAANRPLPRAPRRGLAGGALMAGTLAIALLAWIAVPGLSTSSTAAAGTGGVVFGAGISPLIDLGEDLRQPRPTRSFEYTTDSPARLYFKLLTLDEFSGTTWSSGNRSFNPERTVDEVGAPLGLGEDVPASTVTTRVDIGNLRSRFLPVPYPSASVRGLEGEWFWEPEGLTVASPSDSTQGQDYLIRSTLIEPTREQLRLAGGEVPEEVERYRELPADMPPIIAETARQVTQGTETSYDAAVALQQFFRSGGFAYSTETPRREGYDGDGMAVLATFLEERSGYCVHFASAMAVMARTLGMPARISLGYLPGLRQPGGSGGIAPYAVQSDDLHSWPEIYFSGIGWVSFEPTPGRGFVPPYAVPESVASPTQPGGTPGQGAAAAPTEAPGAATEEPGSADAGGDGGLPAGVPALLGALAAAILVASAVPGIWRGLQRRRRLRALDRGTGNWEMIWMELVQTLDDVGVDVPSATSPRETAQHLAGVPGLRDHPDFLDRLVAGLESSRYAPPGREDTVPAHAGRELAGVLHSLLRAAPPLARLRARWYPPTGIRASAPRTRREGRAA